MSADKVHDEVREWFGRVVDLPVAEGLERLQEAPPAVRVAVMGLLHELKWRTTFLERAPVRDEDEDPRVGRRLGPFVLEVLVDADGEVRTYRARREDREGLHVAIDVPADPGSSRGAAERLARERSRLDLEHPALARWVDFGTDADGTPWVAREIVEGESIERYCDERRLAVDARLGLALDVAEALRDAHARGAVLGGLESGEVVVDDAGRPRLARPGRAWVARSGGRADDRTAKGDVRSFGRLLYRLLTGRWPSPPPTPLPSEAVGSSLADAGGAELASASENAALLRSTPRRLQRDLAAGFDRVVFRAMMSGPGDCYPDMRELAADLRSLSERRARSTRLGPRVRGLVTDRPLVTLALTAVAMAAFGFVLGTGSYNARAAERDSHELASPVRESLDRSLKSALILLEGDAMELGLPESTVERLEAAAELMRPVLELDGTNTLARELLAGILERLGELHLEEGRARIARPVLQEAVDHLRLLTTLDPKHGAAASKAERLLERCR